MWTRQFRGLIDTAQGRFPSNFKTYTVDPVEVKYLQAINSRASVKDNGILDGRGRFKKTATDRIGGDWDLETIEVEGTDLFKGLKQRIVCGASWQETCLHPDRYIRAHPALPEKYSKYSVSDFLRRGEKLDALIASIQNGFLSSHERGEPFWNEITLNVDRLGFPIHNSSGLHRLCIAKLLKTGPVHCRILIVHENFVGNRIVGLK